MLLQRALSQYKYIVIACWHKLYVVTTHYKNTGIVCIFVITSTCNRYVLWKDLNIGDVGWMSGHAT